MGGKASNDDSPLSRYGLPHANKSGKCMLAYMAIQKLKVVTTSFKKRQYDTWIHPHSKNLYQTDDVLVNKEMLVRFIDAEYTSPFLDSNHNATYLTLHLNEKA